MDRTGMKIRKAARMAYFGIVTACGIAATVLCIWRIAADEVSYRWLILAYLTILSGAFAIKIPGVNSKVSASDTLVFMNLILFGSAAGALTAALDGCLASLRFETPSRRRRGTPFNTAAMALSALAAGEVFYRQLGRKPLSLEPDLGALELVLPVVLSAVVYYLCDSALVAGMIALDNALNMLVTWRVYFLRVSLLSWAGAAAGALIAFSIRSVASQTLLIVVPVLVLIYIVDRIFLGPETEQPIEADNDPVARRPSHRRYHYFIVTLGLGFIALLLIEVLRETAGADWLILALLSACAGFVTIRIPGIKIKITLADTFVFANTILFGPVVGGITAALDGLSGSLRCRSKARRMEFALFNTAAMALSAYLAGKVFFHVLGSGPLFRAEKPMIAAVFLPVLSLAITHYLLNALSVATIIALEKKASILKIWRENLLWGIADYAACALGAVFIAAGILAVTPAIAIAVLLLLACIYATCRAFAENNRARTNSLA